LGRERWVVERSISWLHQHRRLRVQWERRDDIHEAFLVIACCLILQALAEAADGERGHALASTSNSCRTRAFMKPRVVLHNRPPQAKTCGNGRSEMRVLLSPYRAGVWL
jgi:Transposase DDE domain